MAFAYRAACHDVYVTARPPRSRRRPQTLKEPLPDLSRVALATRRYPRRQRPAPTATSVPQSHPIAVLVQNMSGDPEQEYFADGVVEEIIAALSRFLLFFFSLFFYRHAPPLDLHVQGPRVDIKKVGSTNWASATSWKVACEGPPGIRFNGQTD